MRQEGTGLWLLNLPEFQHWLSAPKQVLICPGIPGAGKTVMSSIVIHFLNTTFRKDADVKVAFLFCSYQSQHVQKSDDLLSNLLRQLAYRNSGKLCSHVEDPYKERLAADWTALDHEKMTSALSHTARSYKKIFIVVDGLDEHLPSNPEERRQLLSELFKLQNDLPVSFALCF